MPPQAPRHELGMALGQPRQHLVARGRDMTSRSITSSSEPFIRIAAPPPRHFQISVSPFGIVGQPFRGQSLPLIGMTSQPSCLSFHHQVARNLISWKKQDLRAKSCGFVETFVISSH
jgi:hypothetical protein